MIGFNKVVAPRRGLVRSVGSVEAQAAAEFWNINSPLRRRTHRGAVSHDESNDDELLENTTLRSAKSHSCPRARARSQRSRLCGWPLYGLLAALLLTACFIVLN